jgi:hypothetical protein
MQLAGHWAALLRLAWWVSMLMCQTVTVTMICSGQAPHKASKGSWGNSHRSSHFQSGVRLVKKVMRLCCAVCCAGIRVPPSLGNIYKEVAQDVGAKVPKHGCLQKVRLLDTTAQHNFLCMLQSVLCVGVALAWAGVLLWFYELSRMLAHVLDIVCALPAGCLFFLPAVVQPRGTAAECCADSESQEQQQSRR